MYLCRHSAAAPLDNTVQADPDDDVLSQSAWPIMDACFKLLVEAIKDHPLNRLRLWNSIGWAAMADVLASTGCYHHPKFVLPALYKVFNLAIEENIPFIEKGIDATMQLTNHDVFVLTPSDALAHLPLVAQPITSSVLRRVIRNASAIKLLLSLLASWSETVSSKDNNSSYVQSVQVQILRELVSLLEGDRMSHSPRNKESMADAQVLSHFLQLFGDTLLSTADHPVHSIALTYALETLYFFCKFVVYICAYIHIYIYIYIYLCVCVCVCVCVICLHFYTLSLVIMTGPASLNEYHRIASPRQSCLRSLH